MNTKGTSGNRDNHDSLSNQEILFKKCFLFSFEDSNLAWACEGRSELRKNSENFFQSREKIFTNRNRHLLFCKTSLQYYTAVP